MSTAISTMATDEQASHPTRQDAASIQSPPEQIVNEVVHLFKLLADETRVRILYFLTQSDELNVRELCRLLRQRQPSVSHHLALLRVAGLIEMRREGKHNFYRLVPTRVQQLITSFSGTTPGQPARVCFEGFEVRYTPHDTTS